MVHELKTLEVYFQPVYAHKKTFEVRTNDRNFKVGDWLYLREIDCNATYTGRMVFAYVSYILDEVVFCAPDMVIMSLRFLIYPKDQYEAEKIMANINAGTIWQLIAGGGY
jgi:hypothetical protein